MPKSCPKRYSSPKCSSSSLSTIEDKDCSVSESDKHVKRRSIHRKKKIHNVHNLHEIFTHNHPVVVKTYKKRHVTVDHKPKIIVRKECSSSERVCASSSSSSSEDRCTKARQEGNTYKGKSRGRGQ